LRRKNTHISAGNRFVRVVYDANITGYRVLTLS
jgi:hypothetical protein